MTVPRHLSHPGPRNPSRYAAMPCLAHPVSLRLRAGMTFDRAVTAAFAGAGFDAGYVTLQDARFAHLAYVIPGPAPGDGRAAWYRSVPTLDDATVSLAGLHLGKRSGIAVQHCHGLWSAADGRFRMGHMLLSDSTLSDITVARGWGLQGAALHVLQDPETGFDLFAPVKTGSVETPNAVLCTLRPNEDPHAVLEEIAEQAGIGSGMLAGIGSLVDTHFTTGTFDSYATETLIRSGHVENGTVELDVASVGFDGVPRCGPLRRGANRVCITTEILMIGL